MCPSVCLSVCLYGGGGGGLLNHPFSCIYAGTFFALKQCSCVRGSVSGWRERLVGGGWGKIGE